MSGTGGTCWTRCFLCSSPVGVVGEGERKDGRKGVVVVEQLGSVKLLMKYLLQDVGLKSPLSVNVMYLWRGEEEVGEGTTTTVEDGGGFSAKLCTYCRVQARSLTKLQLELEVIQMKIVSVLEGLKKAVIGKSRLYGRNVEVKQDFDAVEEKLSQLEADGRNCSRGREFLETIHHFQTFVFENENKTAHIPLVYLEKFTGQKIRLALSSGLNLESTLPAADTIKEEPEDYSEPMEEADEEADSRYDLEHSTTPPPLLPPFKIEDEDVPTRRRPRRKSAQQASARFKRVKKNPKKAPSKPKLSEAHLLHLQLRREKFAKRWAGGKPQRNAPPDSQHFECEECGIKFLWAGASYKPEQHLREHETPFLERNYECPDCKLGFKQKQYFELHLSYHSKYKTRKCDICTVRIPFAEMGAHLKTHQEQVFDCPHCSMCYATFDNVVAHLRYHANISVKCELCCPKEDSSSSDSSRQYYYYQRRADLCRHLFECHGKSEYRLECPVDGCSQAFFDEAGLTNHQLVHAGIHKCSVCSKSFQCNGDVDKHIRKEHPDQVKLWFWCDVNNSCLEKFLTESQLDRHKMLKHGKPKLKCKMCSKEFFNKTSLHHHERVKHGLGKALPTLVCSLCGLQLSSAQRLKTHEATHNREKTFTCEICGFSTKAEEFLRRHKEVHKAERERNFPCPHCPDAFYNSSTLKSHVRRHTGDRPFQCEDCGSAFNQKSALNVHKRKHVEGKVFVGRGPRASGRKGKEEKADNGSTQKVEGPSTFQIQDNMHPAVISVPPPVESVSDGQQIQVGEGSSQPAVGGGTGTEPGYCLR